MRLIGVAVVWNLRMAGDSRFPYLNTPYRVPVLWPLGPDIHRAKDGPMPGVKAGAAYAAGCRDGNV
jgi:hypothetical protein